MAQQTMSVYISWLVVSLSLYLVHGDLCGGALRAGKIVRPRMPAPDFRTKAVTNGEFVTVSLSDFKGKWLVLVFYPFDFTFVCPTELVAFSELSESFRKINTEVVGVSTDSHHTHLAWIKTPRSQGGLGQIQIPLLADISKEMSAAYGVLIDDPNDSLYGAALRATFIIDPNAVIRSVLVNDESVGRSVDEALRLLQAFQYADERGDEGCPANWHVGDDTVKTSPDAAKNFFTKWSEQHLS